MDISNHARQARRTVVLQAIQELREAFPLQQELEQADTLLRQTYMDVLAYWTERGVPPDKNNLHSPSLAVLHSLDALVIEEYGIGCYPFSAHATDVHVRYADITVHGTCAIDAFVIPRLVGQPSRITGPCALCRAHIACSVAANGSVDGGYPDGLRVMWASEATTQIGRHNLCKKIAFVCTHCEIPREAISFTIPEAAVIGNSLFAFQKRWLAQRSS